MAGEVFSSLITSVNPNLMNAGSRNGIAIDRIIIHHNATTNKDVAMNTWLVSGSAGTSAHYELTPTEIIGCVGEQYAAYHAGGTGGSDIPKISNPNQRSIGIENVNSSGAPNWSVDPRTITNCAKLVADICKRYNIPCDRQHVLGHNEVTATACPGGISVDEVVRQAKQIMGGTTPTPTPTPTPSKTATVAKHATHYSNSSKKAPIAGWVKGGTFDILQEKNTTESNSTKEYLLGNKGKAIGWVLSQDIVGGSTKPTPTPTPSNTGKWIAENGTFIPSMTLPLTVDASGNGALIANIGAGQAIKYNAYMIDSKYVWIRQPRGNGYGYMATGNAKDGKRVDKWGTFQ